MVLQHSSRSRESSLLVTIELNRPLDQTFPVVRKNVVEINGWKLIVLVCLKEGLTKLGGQANNSSEPIFLQGTPIVAQLGDPTDGVSDEEAG
jgi:hypothetical protein